MYEDSAILTNSILGGSELSERALESSTLDLSSQVKPVVLIVDDAPANIQVLASCLKDDYQIKVATNGARCLELAEISPEPDLILLDILMPDLDGYEVCKQLKQNEMTRNIPVIFVTAKDNDEEEEKGLSLGAVDYITKPIRTAIVAARVKTHVMLKQQHDLLAHMAMRDQLTGLYNRHYLLDAACRKVSRAIRHKYPVCLLMIDVDYFKKINDEHGHVVGDEVLKDISTLMEDCSRREDVVSRFGGEEFVVLLGHCDAASALEKAEQLLESIERLKPGGIDVTVSIGIAELLPDGETFAGLLARADVALYKAKENGRNRVERQV